MFGSFSPTANQGGDQLVGAVATTAIRAMFQQTDTLTAQVRAFPVAKILMGSLDGFDLKGQGLLMRNGLRIQQMELKVQAISLDIGAVFGGAIKLRQPTSSTIQVVLTEQDLSRAFNTPFIREKLHVLTLDDQPLTFQDTKVQLLDGGLLRLQSLIAVGKTVPQPVSLQARIHLEGGRRILFSEPEYEGDPESQRIAEAVIAHINLLLDLDKFKLDGVTLRIFRCDIRRGQLVFHGSAQIRQFPGSK
ncbi:DUF2993 domain-containing protein [Candidatus Cyanaurora vandensis]|uniref:LmeA family phospholipid-binding protein n=1 Tax=Candidatus Cyanaurora vandensis TaxID=2714958 RepID=UPI00257D8B25|nr:DUF2993 domain-containing protein [Candidatus Cyanaurora vandensis]